MPTSIPSDFPSSTPSVLIIKPSVEPSQAPTRDCSDFDFGGTQCAPNIFEEAQADTDLMIIVALFELADLAYIFECPGPFTALFPSQRKCSHFLVSWSSNHCLIEAFANADPVLINSLLDPANIGVLRSLLLYHVLPGETMTSAFTAGPTATLLSGETVNVGVSPISFDGSGVTDADNGACNGLYNVIDTVLDPNITPTLSPTLTPTLGIVIRTVPRWFISYASDDDTVPTEEQYEALRTATEEYFLNFLTTQYAGAGLELLDVRLNLDFTLEGDDAQIPDDQYNIYMEYESAVLTFATNPDVPDEEEILSLMASGITSDYIENVVQGVLDSPFTQVTMAFLEFVLAPTTSPKPSILSSSPSGAPSIFSSAPSSAPTGSEPPSSEPSDLPSSVPTGTQPPSQLPSDIPSSQPTKTFSPTDTQPSASPTGIPVLPDYRMTLGKSLLSSTFLSSLTYILLLDLVMPIADQAVFTGAAARWESVITGDLPDVPTSALTVTPLDGCSYPSDGIIDDVYICGVLDEVDGVGNLVGFGMPTFSRSSGGLPAAGEMRFDTADLDTVKDLGLFETLITHEMGE